MFGTEMQITKKLKLKMMALKLLLFFLFFLQQSIGSESCITYCGSQVISFPFQLKNQPDDDRCGYPGFDLSCNNRSQAIITFPSSGDFTVDRLDYYSQNIWLTDPAGCLAKRLIDGFDPTGTPFQQAYLMNLTFLNCSADIPYYIRLETQQIPCLSSENNSVLVIETDRSDLFANWSQWCLNITSVTNSMPYYYQYLDDRIELTWSEPDCKNCLKSLGTCHYEKKTGLDVGCSFPPHTNTYRSTGISGVIKFFIFFSLISFLCVLGYCGRWWCCANEDISRSNMLQSTAVKKSLDRQTIEMYPTTVVGESRQLPKPDDNTCSICLTEYKPKDTLRTIPSCMHYFHANCVDEWLKRSATCPLCRE